MAVIILSGADFSANNIGRISLNIPFSERTKEMLSFYGIEVNEKDSFQRDFNLFVLSLEEANVFNNLKGLCLPFMANVNANGSLSTASINAIDGSNFFTSDIQGSLILDNNGFKAVEGGAVAKVAVKKFSSVTTDNFHIGAYNITTESDMFDNEGKIAPKYMFGRFNAAYGLCKISHDNGAPAVLDSSLSWLKGDVNYKNSSSFICCNITGTKTNIFTNGQKTEKDLVPKVFTNADNAYFLTYFTETYPSEIGDNDTYCRAAYSVMTVGEALSDEQVSTLTTAINKFMESVKKFL